MRKTLRVMRNYTGLAWAAFLLIPMLPGPARAAEPNHPEIGTLTEILAAVDSGAIDLDDLRALGLSVFSTPFNEYDGYGDGPYDPSETNPVLPGQRPTLQGNGLLLRINGLDAQSCNECHSMSMVEDCAPSLICFHRRY